MSKLEKNDVVVSVTRYASYWLQSSNEYVEIRSSYYKSIESLDSSPEWDLEKLPNLIVSFPQIYTHDYVLFRTDQFLHGT